MRLFFSLLVVLVMSYPTVGQDKILTKTDVLIPCQIELVTSQLVRFVDKTTNQRDFLPTLDIRELRYTDSLRVLVQPASEQGRVRPVSFADLANAIKADDYATLLHSRAVRYDLAFVSGQATLTAEGRRQAIALAALFATKPQLHLALKVYTDTLGKAVANKALSDRRANSLRNLLVTNGVLARNLAVQGLGESEPVAGTGALSRRVSLQVVSVDRVTELYGIPYTPPQQADPQPVVTTEATSTATASATTTPPMPVPAKPSRIGVVLYGEGLYALVSPTKTWVDADQGIGILQGFGWGLLVNYYLTPRFALSFQGGYAKWQVQRRYKTDGGDVVYTNDEALKRIMAQVGFRVYALRSVYLQPMGGGQLMTLTSQNSDTHPDGALITETKKFMPTFGGSLGFELGTGGVVADIAAQYQVTPNTDFSKATGPLHYVGLRLGVGFRPKAR